MSISDLYSTGFRERNRDHFAAIVRVALIDGVISPDEKKFLDRLANNLDVSADEYERILENPNAYPVNPPYTYETRLERLYDLARMVFIDEHLADTHELNMLRKLAVGLGFTPANINYIIDKALKLVSRHVPLDVFVEEMRHMNR
ncbi:MAG: TerB family tellurite resistance protein [Flavobacteriaceae bacterium]|nr:TerB family tellurite resistance protein [Flavobacteriaceae bacterium]